MAAAVVCGSWDEDRERDEDCRIRQWWVVPRAPCDVRRETRNEDRNCILSDCRARMAREAEAVACCGCECAGRRGGGPQHEGAPALPCARRTQDGVVAGCQGNRLFEVFREERLVLLIAV